MFEKSKNVIVAQVLSMALKFISNILLAWFLLPNEFGLMAIILPIIIGFYLFSDIGVNTSVIRSHNSENRVFITTAYTLNVLRGCVLSFAIVLLSIPLESYYQLDGLSYMLSICGLTLMIRGAESIGIQLAYRQGNVVLPLKLELFQQFVASIISISLAIIYQSAWAIIIGMVLSTLVKTLISHKLFHTKIFNLGFDKNSFSEIFSFGKWVFLSTIFGFLILQFDRLYLAKNIDLELLGIYFVGCTLAFIPNDIIQKISHVVLYPRFSELNRIDTNALRIELRKYRVFILLAMYVLIGGLVIVANYFFNFFYSEKYYEAGRICILLALSVWFYSAQSTIDRAILAQGKSKNIAFMFAFTFIFKVTIGIVFFLLFGLYGFIVALALGQLPTYLYVIMWAKKEYGTLLKVELLSSLSIIFLIAIQVLSELNKIHQITPIFVYVITVAIYAVDCSKRFSINITSFIKVKKGLS